MLTFKEFIVLQEKRGSKKPPSAMSKLLTGLFIAVIAYLGIKGAKLLWKGFKYVMFGKKKEISVPTDEKDLKFLKSLKSNPSQLSDKQTREDAIKLLMAMLDGSLPVKNKYQFTPEDRKDALEQVMYKLKKASILNKKEQQEVADVIDGLTESLKK